MAAKSSRALSPCLDPEMRWAFQLVDLFGSSWGHRPIQPMVHQLYIQIILWSRRVFKDNQTLQTCAHYNTAHRICHGLSLWWNLSTMTALLEIKFPVSKKRHRKESPDCTTESNSKKEERQYVWKEILTSAWKPSPCPRHKVSLQMLVTVFLSVPFLSSGVLSWATKELPVIRMCAVPSALDPFQPILQTRDRTQTLQKWCSSLKPKSPGPLGSMSDQWLKGCQ